jgi:hypothetical protein
VATSSKVICRITTNRDLAVSRDCCLWHFHPGARGAGAASSSISHFRAKRTETPREVRRRLAVMDGRRLQKPRNRQLICRSSKAPTTNNSSRELLLLFQLNSFENEARIIISAPQQLFTAVCSPSPDLAVCGLVLPTMCRRRRHVWG